MLNLNKLVYDYITGEGCKSNLEISELFDNYEDIEIAMQIWEEVNVWIQFTLDEVRIFESHFFQLLGDVEHWIVNTQTIQYIVASLFDDFCARIEVLVYTVTEAHQTERVVFIFCFVNPLLYIAAIVLDALQHFDYRFVVS